MDIDLKAGWIADAISKTGAAGLVRVVRMELPYGTRQVQLSLSGAGPVSVCVYDAAGEPALVEHHAVLPPSLTIAAKGIAPAEAFTSLELAVFGPCWLHAVAARGDDAIKPLSIEAKQKNKDAILKHASAAFGSLLWPNRAFRLGVHTTVQARSALDAAGKPLLASAEKTIPVKDYAFFATSGPPGLVPPSVPGSSFAGEASQDTKTADGSAALVGALATLQPYVRSTLPAPRASAVDATAGQGAASAIEPGADEPPAATFAHLPVAIDFLSAEIGLMYRLAGSDLTLVLAGPDGSLLDAEDGTNAARASTFVASPYPASVGGNEALWLTQLAKVVQPLPDDVTNAWLTRERLLLQGVRRPLGALCDARAMPLLLRERFEPPHDGSTPPQGWPQPGWQPVLPASVQTMDDKPTATKADWQRVTLAVGAQAGSTPLGDAPYAMRQTVNAGQDVANGISREGPLLVYRGVKAWDGAVPGDPANWTSYAVSAWVRPGDDDGIGLLARYQDDDVPRYYRFELNAELGFARLLRRVGALETSLCELPYRYDAGRDVLLELRVQEVAGTQPSTHLRALVDGVCILAAADASPGRPSAGTVALYCWWQQGVLFADVRVADLRPIAKLQGGEAAQEPPAQVALRFPVPTSRYLDFGHLLQSGDGVLLRGDLTPTAATAKAWQLWADAATPWTPDASPPAEPEGRAFIEAFAALRCALPALGTEVAGVRVAAVELKSVGHALLLQSPEPLDWRRTSLLSVAARSNPPLLAPQVWLRPQTAAIVGAERDPTAALVADRVTLRMLAAPPDRMTLDCQVLGDPLAMADAPQIDASLTGLADAGPLFRAAMATGVLGQFALANNPAVGDGGDAGNEVAPNALGPWTGGATAIAFGGAANWSWLRPGSGVGLAPYANNRVVAKVELHTESAIALALRSRAIDDQLQVTIARLGKTAAGFQPSIKVTAAQPTGAAVELANEWTGCSKLIAAPAVLLTSFEVEVLLHDATLVVYIAGSLAFVSTAVANRDSGAVLLGASGGACEVLSLEIYSQDVAPLSIGPGAASALGLIQAATAQQGPAAGQAFTGSPGDPFSLPKAVDGVAVIGTSSVGASAATTLALASAVATDVDVSCDLRLDGAVVANDGAPGVGLVARWQDDAHWIGALVVAGQGDGLTVRVDVRVGTSVTTIANKTVNLSPKTPKRLRLSIVGGRVRVYLQGALCCDVNEGVPEPAAGRVGVIARSVADIAFGGLCIIDRTPTVGPFATSTLGSQAATSWCLVDQRLVVAASAIGKAAAPQQSLGDFAVAILKQPQWGDARAVARVWLPAPGRAGLVLRYVDRANWVVAQIERDVAGNAIARIVRSIDGVATALTEAKLGAFAGQVDAAGELPLTFEACGARLRLWIGSTLIGVAMDNTLRYGAAGVFATTAGTAFAALHIGAPWPLGGFDGYVPPGGDTLRWTTQGDAGTPMASLDETAVAASWQRDADGWWRPTSALAAAHPVMSAPLTSTDAIVAARMRCVLGESNRLVLAATTGSARMLTLRCDWQTSTTTGGKRLWRLFDEAAPLDATGAPSLLWQAEVATNAVLAFETWVLRHSGQRVCAWIGGVPLLDVAISPLQGPLRCGVLVTGGGGFADLQAHPSGRLGVGAALSDDFKQADRWLLPAAAPSQTPPAAWDFGVGGAKPPATGPITTIWRQGPAQTPRRIALSADIGPGTAVFALGVGKAQDGGPLVEVRIDPALASSRLRVRNAQSDWTDVATAPLPAPTQPPSTRSTTIVVEVTEAGCRAWIDARALGSTAITPTSPDIAVSAAGSEALAFRSMRVEVGRWCRLRELTRDPTARAATLRAGDEVRVAARAGAAQPAPIILAPPDGQPCWPMLDAAPKLRLRDGAGKVLHELCVATAPVQPGGSTMATTLSPVRLLRSPDGRGLLLLAIGDAAAGVAWAKPSPLQLSFSARWRRRPPACAGTPKWLLALTDVGAPDDPDVNAVITSVIG